MGMFEAFEAMKGEDKARRYAEKLAENAETGDGETPLGLLIADALADDAPENRAKTDLEVRFDWAVDKCAAIRDTAWFSLLVTSTIMVVGVFIGVETDQFMSCERFYARGNRPKNHDRCDAYVASIVMAYLSQAIFTFEAGVKIMAEGHDPKQYFDDGWNCMDFFIVWVGFIEMSPLAFIFEAFPVVILRLLRLLRVFRLAKALPRLRSIVEALISGFSAVGWIVVLILVFNYIAACMLMLCKALPPPRR